jgi:hypothetical protein
MRFRHLLPLAALAAVLTFAGSAEAEILATGTFNFRVSPTFSGTGAYWSGGHGDIDVHQHNGEWEVHYHFHSEVTSGTAGYPTGGNGFPGEPEVHDGENEWEWEAGDLTTWLNTSGSGTTLTQPGGAQWAFTGVTEGQPLYVIPATSTPGVPYLGFSAHDFDTTYILGAVTGGHISAWTVDGFGAPTALWSSSNPSATVDNNRFLVTTQAGHVHVFLGFSQQGDYSAAITAVPEPTSIGLAAVGAVGLAGGAVLRRRRRREPRQ